MPTDVKHGEVTKRQGHIQIICFPVECYTPMLTISDLVLTEREVEELLETKHCFMCPQAKIMAKLADLFQLIHVQQIIDEDYDVPDDYDTNNPCEKMTALWNVDHPLNKAGNS